jgi:hypothetical protein
MEEDEEDQSSEPIKRSAHDSVIQYIYISMRFIGYQSLTTSNPQKERHQR